MAYGLPFYDTIGATQTTDYGDKREANTNGDAEEAVDLYWACKPPLPSLELLKNMANKVTIRNEKYFKPFDNTDNPCCWQVDHISDDVDTILDASGIDYEVIP